MKNKQVIFQDWGLIDYKQAWEKQETLFNNTIEQKIKIRNSDGRSMSEDGAVATSNYLVFCEHPHVYTLGKSGKPEHLLLDEDGLRAMNAVYYPINRGGDITYHGPGQLVS